jgi:hypothetical protein
MIKGGRCLGYPPSCSVCAGQRCCLIRRIQFVFLYRDFVKRRIQQIAKFYCCMSKLNRLRSSIFDGVGNFDLAAWRPDIGTGFRSVPGSAHQFKWPVLSRRRYRQALWLRCRNGLLCCPGRRIRKRTRFDVGLYIVGWFVTNRTVLGC